MVTAMLILVTLVLVVGLVGMFVQVLRGELCATVWWCCGGFTGTAELIGTLVVAIVSGISEAAKG